MSTLTALKLARELDLTRRSMAERPKLVIQWSLEPHSGRPVASWTAEPAAEIVTVMREPVFA